MTFKVWPNWYYGRNDYGRSGTMDETSCTLPIWQDVQLFIFPLQLDKMENFSSS
jgi:hypothetical protein